jgi:methylthioribose-1-phosphate isomerase
VVSVRITPEGARAANFGFDVTPARLVTAIVTERGVCEASHAELTGLFPDLAERAA